MKMLNMPAIMNIVVSIVLPMARLPVAAAILITLMPMMRATTNRMIPASPKKNKGLLCEIMTII